MDLPQSGPQANHPNHQQVVRFYLPADPSLGCPPFGIPFAPPTTPIPSFSVSPCYQNFAPMGSLSFGSGGVRGRADEKTCAVCFRPVSHQSRDGVKYVCNRCRAFFRRFVRKECQGGGTWPCLTTRRKVTIPLRGDEKVVCNLMFSRDSCQPCRFISCVEAGLKVANVTLSADSTDSSLNASSTSSSTGGGPRDEDEVNKTGDASFQNQSRQGYYDGEFGGRKIILLRKEPPPPATPPKLKPPKKTKVKKCSLHRYNVTNAEYNNKRWNNIMGPFLKNQPTVEDQLLAKLSRGHLANRAKLVSPVADGSDGGKAVILGKRGGDVFNLKPHSQLPSIKVANIRRQENEMLAERMINAKSLLVNEKKEERKLAHQKKLEEVAKGTPDIRYFNLKKVVSQNALQREIDNSYAKIKDANQDNQRVEEKPQFILTPLVPLGEVLQRDDENNMEMRPVNPREVELPAKGEPPLLPATVTSNDAPPDSVPSSGDSGEVHQPGVGEDVLDLDREADNADFLDELLVGADDASLGLGLQSSPSDVSFLCSLTESPETFVNDQVEDQSLESIINTNARLANFNGIEI